MLGYFYSSHATFLRSYCSKEEYNYDISVRNMNFDDRRPTSHFGTFQMCNSSWRKRREYNARGVGYTLDWTQSKIFLVDLVAYSITITITAKICIAPPTANFSQAYVGLYNVNDERFIVPRERA